MGNGWSQSFLSIYNRTQLTMKEYFKIGEVFTYFFRKKDPNVKESTSLKAMHFVNKLSIAIFLVCLIVILYRLFIR